MKYLRNICLFMPIFMMQAVTFVYNLRISESTRRQPAIEKYLKPSIFAITEINQFRKRHDGTQQSIYGFLPIYIYSFKKFYINAQTAFGHLKQTHPYSFSRTQMDDILFSAGYNYTLSPRTRFTLSGLLGVPTHKDYTPQPQMGTGHVGLGGQTDCVMRYSLHHNNYFLIASRFIHFFPRTISFPILQHCRSFRLGLGNVLDVLFGHALNWKKRHSWEIGYNPAFAFGGYLKPKLPQDTFSDVGIRSSFYTNYKYFFFINGHTSGLILGFSYSFDHRPKLVGNKYVITAWGTWGINF